MSVKSSIFRVVMSLVLVAVIVTAGVFVYRSGVADGLTQTIDLKAVEEGSIPMLRGYSPYSYQMPYHGGFGFSFLRIIGSLFFFFLILGILRLIFFPRRYFAHYGIHARRHLWKDGFDGKTVPPFIKEWHNQMHQSESETNSEKSQGQESVDSK